MAQLSTSIELVSISELGLVVTTSQALQDGQVVELESEFFKRLKVAPPPMKVLSSKKAGSGNKFEAQLIFLGAREPLLQKIRAWILSHGSDQKNNVA